MAQAVKSDSLLDYSWQALLHRGLLSQTSDVLGVTPEDDSILELAANCISKKTICKAVPLPTDPQIKAVFDRVICKAIQEAAKQLIDARQFKLDNQAASYAHIVQMSQRGSPLVAASASQTVKTYDKEFAQLRDEIKLLQEWSQSPMRMFTDPLKPL